MNARPFSRLTVTGALACVGVLGFSAPAAFGSAAQIDPTGHGIDVGQSPVAVPGNCPFGNGDNIQGQQEFGTTVNFTGTSLSDSTQTVSIHVSFGGAIPAHSTTPAANHVSVNIVCR